MFPALGVTLGGIVVGLSCLFGAGMARVRDRSCYVGSYTSPFTDMFKGLKMGLSDLD